MVGAAIGFVILTGGLFFVFYFPWGMDWIERSSPWIDFVGYTLVIFVCTLQAFRPPHPNRRFWGLVFAIMLIHTFAIAAFIHYVRPVRGIQYLIFSPFDALLIAVILEGKGFRSRLLRKRRPTHSDHSTGQAPP